MTGVSLILLGTVAISNVALVAFLVKDYNGRANKQESQAPPSPPVPPQTPPPAPPAQVEVAVQPASVRASVVGKSKFNIDEFDRRFEELQTRFQNILDLLDKVEAEVRLRDVEFRNPEDRPTQEQINRDNEEEANGGNIQVSHEKIDEIFGEPSMNEVEPDNISAPSATGTTIDEIEEALETVVDPKASTEAKAKAGRILFPYIETNLFASLVSEEEILQAVLKCANMAVRESIADKTKLKSASQQPKEKPTPPESSRTSDPPRKPKPKFKISDSEEDFDLDSILG